MLVQHAWKESNSMGPCPLDGSITPEFLKNPQYSVQLTSPVPIFFVLQASDISDQLVTAYRRNISLFLRRRWMCIDCACPEAGS